MAENSGSGTGWVGVAIVVLVTLKLAGVAPVDGWSWVVVIGAPVAVSVGIWAAAFGVIFLGLLLGAIGRGLSEWRGQREIERLMARMGDDEKKADHAT